MPVTTSHSHQPDIRLQTSVVYEVMAALRSLQISSRTDCAISELWEDLKFFYGNFDYGAQFAELAVDYPYHHSFEGFIDYVRQMSLPKFLYYVLGRYLSIEDIEVCLSPVRKPDRIVSLLRSKGVDCNEAYDKLLSKPEHYQKRLVRLWEGYWCKAREQILECEPLWNEAIERVQELISVDGWQHVVEQLLTGRKLPPQFPEGFTLNQIILVPSVKMTLRYFIIWGFGSTTIVFDAIRLLHYYKGTRNPGSRIVLDPTDSLKRISALSERTRLEILRLIYHRPDARAVDIAASLGLSQAAVSKHLALLEDAQIVRKVKRTNRFTYEILEENVSKLSSEIMFWIRSAI